MSPRLRRAPGHRFVGTRDDMTVYDCDDEASFSLLETRIEFEDLIGQKMISTFAPDSLTEARNRGFSLRS